MKRVLAAQFSILVLAGVLAAHEGMQHLLGRVTAVTESSITVETAGKEPKLVTVSITPQTKVEKDGSPALLKDLKAGERVVVHAKENNKKLEAALVIFGRPAPRKK